MQLRERAWQGAGLSGSASDITGSPWGVSLLQRSSLFWGNNCRVPGCTEDTGALWQGPWTLGALLTWSLAAKFRREGRELYGHREGDKTVIPAWPHTFSEGDASLPWGGGSPPPQRTQLALPSPSQHTQLALPPEQHPCELGESTSLGSRRPALNSSVFCCATVWVYACQNIPANQLLITE